MIITNPFFDFVADVFRGRCSRTDNLTMGAITHKLGSVIAGGQRNVDAVATILRCIPARGGCAWLNSSAREDFNREVGCVSLVGDF